MNDYKYILYDINYNIQHTMIGIKHSKSSVIIKSLFVSGISEIVPSDNTQINDTKCNIGKDIGNSCHFFECLNEYNLHELDTALLAKNTCRSIYMLVLQ